MDGPLRNIKMVPYYKSMRHEQLDSSLKVVKFLIRRQITLHITKNPNNVRMKNMAITVVVQIRKDLGGFF